MNLLQRLVNALKKQVVSPRPNTRPGVVWPEFPHAVSDPIYTMVKAEMERDSDFDYIRRLRTDLTEGQLLQLYNSWRSPCFCEFCMAERDRVDGHSEDSVH